MTSEDYVRCVREATALGVPAAAAAAAVSFLGRLLAVPGAPAPSMYASDRGSAVILEWWKSSDVLLVEVSPEKITGEIGSGPSRQKLGCGRGDDGEVVLELVGAWGASVV